MARVTLAEDTLLGRRVALKRVFASGDSQLADDRRADGPNSTVLGDGTDAADQRRVGARRNFHQLFLMSYP
jgi:hypothetical protein